MASTRTTNQPRLPRAGAASAPCAVAKAACVTAAEVELAKADRVIGCVFAAARPLSRAAVSSDLPPRTSAITARAASCVGTTSWVKVRRSVAAYLARSRV